MEQNQEREKKEEKVVKEKDQPGEPQIEEKRDKTARTHAITERFLQLRNHGAFLSAKDMYAIEKVAMLDVPLENILNWMENIYSTYQKKSPNQRINSMAYYEAAIVTRLEKSKGKKKKPQRETLLDRIARLEMQGILQ
ncbi:hypothetical protein [Cytobacillus praedii]|uniref:hypothetical protein n=1 Tax=Cytobacillus praedii TaxID=1742358 RepID=UPI003AF97A01